MCLVCDPDKAVGFAGVVLITEALNTVADFADGPLDTVCDESSLDPGEEAFDGKCYEKDVDLFYDVCRGVFRTTHGQPCSYGWHCCRG